MADLQTIMYAQKLAGLPKILHFLHISAELATRLKIPIACSIYSKIAVL